MKKPISIITICIFAAVLVLVTINRLSSSKNEEAVRAGELEFVTGASSTYYSYDESSEAYTTFSTEMRRRNGDVFEKEYSGIELKDIFSDLGIPVSEGMSVTVVCSDNYEIILSGPEIMEDGNIYLVTRESGAKLDEESGPFMLVVNHDEFSTRWAKNVIKIKTDG